MMTEADTPPAAVTNRRPPLDARQIETLQEIVIRAHYLSLELRDLCAPSGVAPPEMSAGMARMLRGWAIAFTRALERAEMAGDDSIR
jgi:hypothetical protein